jgi:hypothetical protein
MMVAAAACGSAERTVGKDSHFETWNAPNDPAGIDPSFEIRVDELPIAGESARKPIPGDYWATYRDSINVRWDGDGSMSPSEKFEKAFGKTGVPDAVSRRYGIERHRAWSKSCLSGADCVGVTEGASCAKRIGESSGVCIPTWWGICHGWAPYAISEPAPVEPVEHNGVTFFPGDLEGLMSLVYSVGLPIRILAERCSEKAPNMGEDGRIGVGACRDINPGSLHVVAANLLGIRRHGFVHDRTYDGEVWNQPVYAFRVANAASERLREVSPAEAATLVGLPDGSAYGYNTAAKRFFHVVLELDWIAEAEPAHTSHVEELASYSRTTGFEYVLEADEAGRILGGEYVGDSKIFHPDFVWWPVERPAGSVADGLITYEEVAMLHELARGE